MRSAVLVLCGLLLHQGLLAAENRDAMRPLAPHGEPAVRTLALPAGTSDANLDSGSVYFVGNATVIIRYGGFTVLTDPNFLHKGEHVHLGYGLSAERLFDPAIRFEQLPAVDFVLLSHFHGDHFDRLVADRLPKRTPIISTPSAVEELRRRGFSAAQPLGKWQTLVVTKGSARLQVTALPGRHGPPVIAKALPEVMGSLLEFGDERGSRYRIYISGDTLVYDDIKDIPKRYKEMDLALLHLGGTRVTGMLATMDAEQGVEMLQIIDPDVAIPIHYNDYSVFESSLEDFIEAVEAAGLTDKVRYLKHGETYRIDSGRPG